MKIQTYRLDLLSPKMAVKDEKKDKENIKLRNGQNLLKYTDKNVETEETIYF